MDMLATSSTSSSRSLDALPEVFVDSMKTLFDILDDKATGYVRYIDIEERWSDDEELHLPTGVLECLRKVTPASGLLSFDRFVAGLRICLLRSRAESRAGQGAVSQRPISSHDAAPLSSPALDAASRSQPQSVPPASRLDSTAAQQRDFSLCQLHQEDSDDAAPPKPPRQPLAAPTAVGQPTRVQVLTALQRWHRARVWRARGDGRSDGSAATTPVTTSAASLTAPVTAGTAGDLVCSQQLQDPPSRSVNALPAAARLRRREPRRHTLQNGVDHGTLRRIRHLEQEREILERGLQAVETARDWYTNNLAALHQQMKYAGFGRVPMQNERSLDANEERLQFLSARVHETNQQLSALVDSSRRGFPLHMDLQLTGSRHQIAPAVQHTLYRLKQHNQQLTKKVAQGADRIASLEGEKASLIRELFNVRSELPGRSHPVDATLM